MTDFFYYACPGLEDATHIEILFDDGKDYGAAPIPLLAGLEHGSGARLSREEAIELLDQLHFPNPEREVDDVEQHIEHMIRLTKLRRRARP